MMLLLVEKMSDALERRAIREYKKLKPFLVPFAQHKITDKDSRKVKRWGLRSGIYGATTFAKVMLREIAHHPGDFVGLRAHVVAKLGDLWQAGHKKESLYNEIAQYEGRGTLLLFAARISGPRGREGTRQLLMRRDRVLEKHERMKAKGGADIPDAWVDRVVSRGSD